MFWKLWEEVLRSVDYNDAIIDNKERITNSDDFHLGMLFTL